MNPRIRELAEQAGITTNLDTDFFKKDPNKWVDYYSEKFAELIIKECAHLVGGYTKENEFGSASDVKEAYDEITKHFGVEQ